MRLAGFLDWLSEHRAPEVMSAIVGITSLVYGGVIIGDKSLTLIPSFSLALHVFPAWAWGLGWVVFGVASLAGFISRKFTFIPAMTLGAIYLAWTTLIILSYDSVLTAWVIYSGFSSVCFFTALLSRTRSLKGVPRAV